jgi:uncharacterized protein
MASQRMAFHLLAKPAGANCNLACKYCFFLSKEALYPNGRLRMSDEILDAYVQQLLESNSAGEVPIAWQGGEPTLMGLDFFRRAVRLAEKYRRPEQRVLHSIQTNGVLLNDAWCAFLKEHSFLVGLSMDGPKAMHDAYRVNRGGSGSFDQAMKGFEALRRREVDVNILCTIHAANADFPLEVYRFFRDDLQAGFLQFIPIVERSTPELLPLANRGWSAEAGTGRPLYTQTGSLVTNRSVGPEQFGRFLSGVFDEWVRRDVGKVFIQTFDAALGSWLGQHNLCIFSPTCGTALALEHNGDLYSCDHFVEPGYRLGNIRKTRIGALVSSEKQRRFGQEKLTRLPKYCRDCRFLFACYGECPRNRFLAAPDGEPGLNYLCAGYKSFFEHIDGPMKTMARLVSRGRPAEEIMPANHG